MRSLVLAFGLMAGPAFAQCPPPPDHGALEDRILAELSIAPDPGTAQRLSGQLWRLWADAPDDTAQEMLDAGMAYREIADYEAALLRFDELVRYCPDYAEGYNQRAFVNFLKGDYGLALADLDLALARAPRHVAAMSGKALTLIGMDRMDEGQAVLRDALKLNPWLSERQFLIEDEGEEL